MIFFQTAKQFCDFAEIPFSLRDILTKTSSSSYRFIGGARLGDAELVVGDHSEVVGSLRVKVLVADRVVLHRAATRASFCLPFVQI